MSDNRRKPQSNIQSNSTENFRKNFQIKSCAVDLDKVVNSTVQIGCSVESSESGEKFTYDLQQTNSNTFSLKIKRNRQDDVGEPSNSFKKSKLCASESHAAENVTNGMSYVFNTFVQFKFERSFK